MLVQSVESTRVLIGPALQYRLNRIFVSLLVRFPSGIKHLVEKLLAGRLGEECTDAQGTARVFSKEDGKLDIACKDKYSGTDMEIALAHKTAPACTGFRRCTPASFRVRCFAESPDFAVLEGLLCLLDVSANTQLENLPLSILSIKSLTSLCCTGCPRLCSPPPGFSFVEEEDLAALFGVLTLFSVCGIVFGTTSRAFVILVFFGLQKLHDKEER